MTSRKKPLPSAAIRRAQEHEARLKRLQVLYKISDILTTTQRGETVPRRILKEVVKVTRATSASLVLIDRERGVLNIEIGENIDAARAAKLKLRIGEGVTGWVAKTGKPLLVGDVRRSRHYVKIKAGVKSELAAPLIIGGDVVGVINVDSDRADAFTQDDRDLLVAVAAQSAKVMQTASLYEESRLKAERLSALLSVARTVASEPHLGNILRLVAGEVRRLMDARVCSIMLLGEKGEHLEIKAVAGEVSEGYLNRRRIPLKGNVIGSVVESREPLYVPDVRKRKDYRLRQIARESKLCSLLAIPMIFQGKSIGVLNIYSGRPHVFSSEEVELMSALAGYAAVAIVNAKRLEQRFRSEELLRKTEKFQLLGTLSGEMAHEIKNPLTILTMLVHSLKDDASLSGSHRFDLAIMNQNLDNINKIVDQVMDFSRMNQNEWTDVDINRVVEDVLMLVGYKASAMGLRLRRRLSQPLPAVIGDAGQIKQAVLNLAINGLDAMREGGECLYLSTRRIARVGKDWVRVRIHDDGCGIPKEKMQRIFTPFFSMSERGSGLGLFVTRRIVDQHGGKLKVKSRVGEGTAFEIHLPAAES